MYTSIYSSAGMEVVICRARTYLLLFSILTGYLIEGIPTLDGVVLYQNASLDKYVIGNIILYNKL